MEGLITKIDTKEVRYIDRKGKIFKFEEIPDTDLIDIYGRAIKYCDKKPGYGPQLIFEMKVELLKRLNLIKWNK